MIESFKNIIKSLPIPFSKNHYYDILTRKILKQYLCKESNCIDIGCYKGEILDIILKYAPNGQQFGFEPIPSLYSNLVKKYKNYRNCQIENIALSNVKGISTFNHVISNPSYSGIKKRSYDRVNEVDETIEVKVDVLDNYIPGDMTVSLIKIDVEGAEMLVLEGGIHTISRSKPLIIFEHGLGASEYYNTTPEKVFEYFTAIDMCIASLSNFTKQFHSFSKMNFRINFIQKRIIILLRMIKDFSKITLHFSRRRKAAQHGYS